MTRRLFALMAVAGAAAAPAPALAQDPAPAPEPAPQAPAKPPKATLKLTLERVGSGGVLAGRRWVVRGALRPYVKGQRVTVRLHRRGKKIAVRGLTVRPAGNGVGVVRLGFRAKTPGRITVSASHRRTAELGTAVARPVRVEVLPLSATPGARGLAVRVLQARLARLGYVVGRRGVYDDRTARAVTAFRKLTGMARTNVATEDVFRRLARGEGRFKVRFPQHGRHVEANISRQVLALIENGRAVRIYPTSSGAPATPTILGTYRVYMKDWGTNAKGMVHSSYFIRGYAIHGYASVPTYNASHGCLRVPVPDALSIFNWVRYGTIVDTYYD
jgi:peptidoglycan hydrolase-like protein with peptidoglycan-binding domain